MTLILHRSFDFIDGRIKEFFYYFFVSLASLGFDLILFSLCYRFFGLSISVAVVFGFSSGALLNYLLSVKFVFNKRKLINNKWFEIFLFILVGVVGVGITQLILWLGMKYMNIWPESLKLVAAGVTFLFNFIIRKIILF